MIKSCTATGGKPLNTFDHFKKRDLMESQKKQNLKLTKTETTKLNPLTSSIIKGGRTETCSGQVGTDGQNSLLGDDCKIIKKEF